MNRSLSLLAGVSLAALAPFAASAQEQAAEPATPQVLTLQTGVACADLGRANWIAGGDAASDLARADAPFQANVTGENDTPQLLAFRLGAGGAVRLEARTNNSGDPMLRLLGEDGEEIASNDDMENSLNSRIETELPAGDYCVAVGDVSSSLDITLQVSREDQPALMDVGELACTATTEATPFGSGPLSLAKGAVSASTDAERRSYLRFDLAANEPMTLRATAISGIDPHITLFDNDGTAIASNDDADGLNARLDFAAPLPAGTYCLGVGSTSSSAGEISVTAQKLDPAAYLYSAYALGQLPPADDSYPVADLKFRSGKGEVSLLGGAANWFRFTVEKRSVIQLEAFGSLAGADTKLALFDQRGAVVAENDDPDNGTNARIDAVVLPPGDYMLALTDVSVAGQKGAPLRPVVLTAEQFVSVE